MTDERKTPDGSDSAKSDLSTDREVESSEKAGSTTKETPRPGDDDRSANPQDSEEAQSPT